MTSCARCHHASDAHFRVYKHGASWPCGVERCLCAEYTAPTDPFESDSEIL